MNFVAELNQLKSTLKKIVIETYSGGLVYEHYYDKLEINSNGKIKYTYEGLEWDIAQKDVHTIRYSPVQIEDFFNPVFIKLEKAINKEIKKGNRVCVLDAGGYTYSLVYDDEIINESFFYFPKDEVMKLVNELMIGHFEVRWIKEMEE